MTTTYTITDNRTGETREITERQMVWGTVCTVTGTIFSGIAIAHFAKNGVEKIINKLNGKKAAATAVDDEFEMVGD